VTRTLGDALGPALAAPPVPSNGPELVRSAGGRLDLARQLSGMDHSPRRRDYPDDDSHQEARKKWRSAQRTAQRWADGTRTPGKSLTPALKGRLRRRARIERHAALVRDGARARVKATIVVASGGGDDVRTRTVPSGGPGVVVSPDQMETIFDLLDEGDPEGAAAELWDAFVEFGMPEGSSVESVVWLRVWPASEPEPAGSTR